MSDEKDIRPDGPTVRLTPPVDASKPAAGDATPAPAPDTDAPVPGGPLPADPPPADGLPAASAPAEPAPPAASPVEPPGSVAPAVEPPPAAAQAAEPFPLAASSADSPDDDATVVTPPVADPPRADDVGDGETVRLRRPPPAAPAADAAGRVTEPAGSAADHAAPAADAAGPAAEPSRPAAEPAGPDPAGDPAAPSPARAGSGPAGRVPEKVLAPWRRLSSAGALIWVLLALFGFTLVVQLRSNDADSGLASARQEDLVRILSDLEARDQRLQQEINALEESQRQLTSGVAGRQAALAEADKRAEELGLLSGTLPATGPGLKITIDPKGQPIKASAILNAVQELRGAGGEVMELVGDNGVAVRIVASSYFVDADGGEVIVDGKQLSGPYTLWVIGVPATMQTALQIPGGVVASVSQAGGNVTMEQRTSVEVTAVRQPASLQYARPVS